MIQSYIYGDNQAEAEAARVDARNKIGILYNYRVNYHTDLSVFGANAGNTGWVMLSSIESTSGPHATHVHVQHNSYYGGTSLDIQRLFCKYVFQAYGFVPGQEDATDCLGGGSVNLGSHNNSDFYNFYRYH